MIYSRHVLVSLHSSERRTFVPCVLQGMQAPLGAVHMATPGIRYVFFELRKLAAQPPLLSVHVRRVHLSVSIGCEFSYVFLRLPLPLPLPPPPRALGARASVTADAIWAPLWLTFSHCLCDWFSETRFSRVSHSFSAPPQRQPQMRVCVCDWWALAWGVSRFVLWAAWHSMNRVTLRIMFIQYACTFRYCTFPIGYWYLSEMRIYILRYEFLFRKIWVSTS